MKPAIGAVTACFMLAGCAAGNWLELSPGSGGTGSPPASARRGTALRPIPAQVMPTADMASFCEGVAQQAAADYPYDDATRQRVYRARISQCHALLGGQVRAAGGRVADNKDRHGTR
jgi:hypothetical protein